MNQNRYKMYMGRSRPQAPTDRMCEILKSRRYIFNVGKGL